MKYALHLAGGGAVCDQVILRDIAQCAEAVGYDTILAGDHAILPMQIDTPSPYEEYFAGQPFKGVYTDIPWADAFTVVSFVAAYTETVRVGTGVLIVPYRDPFDVARRFATIDVLSGGRLVVGCGAGWMKEEFDLLGVPFSKRGKRTDEYIQAMRAVWTEDNPRINGEFVQLDRDINPNPRPLQKPHPPIWIGGESKAAVRRAARLGDGWHIALLTERQTLPLLDELHRELEALGRDPGEIEISAMVEPGKLSQDSVKRAGELGVETLVLTPLSGDPVGLEREVREFAKRVRDHS
jgi:probable F420-dependent oxidoreductase